MLSTALPSVRSSTALVPYRRPEPRAVWFVWQSSPRGPAPTLAYDEPPPAKRQDGPRVLASYALGGRLLELVLERPRGPAPWGALVAAYPAPSAA